MLRQVFTSLTVGLLPLATTTHALAVTSRQTACPELPVEGPFYLTAIPAASNGNGTGESWPTNIAEVSRGVKILSSALEYTQTYTFDAASSRILKGDELHIGSIPIEGRGSIFIFDSEAVEGDGNLEQVSVTTEDGACAVYLVTKGSTSGRVHVWSSKPPTGLPVGVEWYGSGGEGGELGPDAAALRIDVEAA